MRLIGQEERGYEFLVNCSPREAASHSKCAGLVRWCGEKSISKCSGLDRSCSRNAEWTIRSVLSRKSAKTWMATGSPCCRPSPRNLRYLTAEKSPPAGIPTNVVIEPRNPFGAAVPAAKSTWSARIHILATRWSRLAGRRELAYLRLSAIKMALMMLFKMIKRQMVLQPLLFYVIGH